jgi:hypothetical protein
MSVRNKHNHYILADMCPVCNYRQETGDQSRFANLKAQPLSVFADNSPTQTFKQPPIDSQFPRE